jgi:hypothetical protein
MICQSRKRTSSWTPQNIGICIFALRRAEEVCSGYFQPSYTKRHRIKYAIHFVTRADYLEVAAQQ